jgi:hypothetical protein
VYNHYLFVIDTQNKWLKTEAPAICTSGFKPALSQALALAPKAHHVDPGASACACSSSAQHRPTPHSVTQAQILY